jgi:hypothetical protein
VSTSWDAPENQPLRFNPPDSWRTPHPTWVALHQGFEPEPDWRPYEGCPVAPPHWPFWEENGAAWFAFFRHHQPPPARGLGGWFSITAAGLFVTTAIPFVVGFPEFLIGGVIGLVAVAVGVAGIVRYFRKSATRPTVDPLTIIRQEAASRRDDYFPKKYDAYRQTSSDEKSYQEFIDGLYARWWGESASTEANS